MSDFTLGNLLTVKKTGIKPGFTTKVFQLLQSRIRPPHLRALVSKMVTFHTGPVSKQMSPEGVALAQHGIAMLPGFLSADKCRELVELLETFECVDPWKPQNGKFSINNAPVGTHVADIPAAPCLKPLHDIAFDEHLLELAAEYLKCRPVIDSVQAWWSLPGNTEPEEAENFHRDNDSIRFVKFFLYLTDVGPNDGPHKFVRGSHIENRKLERRRFTDAEIEREFGANNILTITGAGGDAFMEDTFGVHKGQLPVGNRRLLMQVRYAATPTIFRSHTVVEGDPPKTLQPVKSLLHD